MATEIINSVPDSPLCRHGCGRLMGAGGTRGLCWSCYKDRAIRERYPKRPPNRVFLGLHPNQKHEPTEAELDALIAEQMTHLPPWWDHTQGTHHDD